MERRHLWIVHPNSVGGDLKMQRIGVRKGLAVAAAGLALGATAVVPGVAEAADYGGQCGAGFSPGSRRDIPGGTVFLTGNGDLRCAVTILNSTSSAGVSMSVWIRISWTDNWSSDPGVYHKYAGPRTTSSYGCVDYGGRIGTNQVTAYEVCW